MRRLGVRDVHSLEHGPATREILCAKIGAIVDNSAAFRAEVEEWDPETGTYRLVLRGRIEDESPHDR